MDDAPRHYQTGENTMSNYHDFADSLRAIAPEMSDICDNLEREMMLEKALDSCKQYGVPIEHLKTLARESGAVAWAIRNSLKEKA